MTPAPDPGEALWYKDAVIYELHVRTFCDSDGDGVGDFRGLASKLDYLQNLGVTAVWLLPFYPSPLKDEGYDTSDYMNVHPSYGTLADFKHFLKEAHRRNLKVITELVINHTSDQHPWFRKARRSPPGGRERGFYVWSDSPEKYKDARVIFKDFEASNWTWDPAAKAYYWHRFYSHQPDLNFDSPGVRKAVLEVVDYWLGLGVDGLRLDAVPYLLEREGTGCENLSETHAYLKALRTHVDKKFRNRMLLAEANQWPEDAAAYFGEGDECHMAFHFPIMPRLFMAIHMEDRFPIVDILYQTPPIPGNCQWAVFLRNHDELTLEMVTDEERDYMYRVYANDPHARVNLGIRRRLAPLLGNNRRKIELMNGLLFSLPGTPVIYYGDELGMGDNIYLGDRNGVRTPMQWTGDRNAGFSSCNPQKLYSPVVIDPEYHYETVNVEAHLSNVHSLQWWMKRLISLRKRFKAFGGGSIEFLAPENGKVLAFIRGLGEERILVVANLSRFVQYAELDLSVCKGMAPVEMFGNIEFPPIGELPYFLTLGPHSFYWFSLAPAREPQVQPARPAESQARTIAVREQWPRVFDGAARALLEGALALHLPDRRWFGGKAKKIRRVEIFETIPVEFGAGSAVMAFVRVEYREGEAERYVLPAAFASGGKALQVREAHPQAAICAVQVSGRSGAAKGAADGILYDASVEKAFLSELLDAVRRRRLFKGTQGVLKALPGRLARDLPGPKAAPPEPALMRAEQSNTSVVFGEEFVFKLFRRFEEGVNPDLEIGRFLTEKAKFPNVPALAGFLEYQKSRGEPATIGVLDRFAPNQGDAWKYTLDALGRYYERVLSSGKEAPPAVSLDPLDLARGEIDPDAQKLINPYLETARLLGLRTAQLHLALASDAEDPAFAPEPFTPFYQRSLYQSLRNLSSGMFRTLARRHKNLPESVQPKARAVMNLESDILKKFQSILDHKITALRIRCHGDYHLGQVLFTGKDFMIIDFEGEPARNLNERRAKRCPLRDAAGMLRSFHYASSASLILGASETLPNPDEAAALAPWASFWTAWVSSAFLRSYLDEAAKGRFLPKSREELKMLLDVYLLEKAVYELDYELNNRPDWVRIPLEGILRMFRP
ncbi:MAG: maltose alpha-D-glucosyltransferase [Elusimicrobia bacterium RIFCSPHIGHO2_01_FULL_64_10]|nr:MAG: maltose alpha-D-glucosyltransferase [Elusimicrobia bacterium RIFCSPHIGHO2_01_FULL_64_10]